jgi:biopolymer transport protein ExbD
MTRRSPRAYTRDMERHLNLFSLALLGVVFTLFLAVFPPTGIVCDFVPRPKIPWSSASVVLPSTETDLEIRITSDKRIFLGPNIVRANEVRSELIALAQRTSPSRNVIISADGSVPYSLVQDVLAGANAAGFQRLALVTFRGTQLDALQKSGVI